MGIGVRCSRSPDHRAVWRRRIHDAGPRRPADGKNTARPQLGACLKSLREGDTLIVWRLDRLGRSLGDLIRLTHEFKARGAQVSSRLPIECDNVLYNTLTGCDHGAKSSPAKTTHHDPRPGLESAHAAARWPPETREPELPGGHRRRENRVGAFHAGHHRGRIRTPKRGPE